MATILPQMIEGQRQYQFPKERPNIKVLDRKQQKPVQEWGSKKTKNVVGIKDEMEVQQPLVEEPVCFDFGDDYGNNLFLDLEKELAEERSQGIMVKDTNHADDFVYVLSSERDMISFFPKEAL